MFSHALEFRIMVRRTFLIAALAVSILTFVHAADAPQAAGASGKTVRVLKIGNSFSKNVSEFLPQLVASQGHTLVLGNAEIGGCTLEKHWTLAEKYEADAADKDGKPYTLVKADGSKVRASLKELLCSDRWDVVTVQQHSLSAMDAATYQPFAGKLAAYIRKYAPQAKIYVHETWAYRTDNPLIVRQKKTPADMYALLHENYARLAQDIQASGILPTGSAFQNARSDSRWKSDDENTLVDAKTLQYPEQPAEGHALCLGYRWDTKVKPPKLGYDGKHATTAGKYLGAAVWCETLFGPIAANAFTPKGLSAGDAEILRDVAAKTVRGN
jgi:hypothetical protein